MKKVLQLLIIPAFMLGLFISTIAAPAQAIACDEMTISETGPGSENQIICQDETSITILCANNTTVTIYLDQEAGSGNAEVGGNTNGGNANSGDANNENEVVVDVDNACASNDEESETPTTPIIPASTTPTTPAPVVAQATPAKPTAVTTLPNTGNVTTMTIVALSAASIVALLAAARVVTRLNK